MEEKQLIFTDLKFFLAYATHKFMSMKTRTIVVNSN